MIRFGGIPALALALLGIACGGNSGNDAESGSPTPGATTSSATVDVPTAGSTGQSGTELDACALLTKQEVEAAVGAPVLVPAAVVEVPARWVSCQFNSPQFPALQVVRISWFRGTEAEAEALFQPGTGATPVADLGDDASWSDLVATLSILVGTQVIDVQVTEAGGAVSHDDRIDVAQTLAAKALSRIS